MHDFVIDFCRSGPDTGSEIHLWFLAGLSRPHSIHSRNVLNQSTATLLRGFYFMISLITCDISKIRHLILSSRYFPGLYTNNDQSPSLVPVHRHRGERISCVEGLGSGADHHSLGN